MVATVPTLKTWSTGELATAAQMNSNVRNSVDFLISKPFVFLTNTTTQSIPDATWTEATWNTEIVDSENMHSTVSDTADVTIVHTGLYAIRGCAFWSPNLNGGRGVAVDKIDPVTAAVTTLVRSGTWNSSGTAGVGTAGSVSEFTSCSFLIWKQLNSGDTVHMVVRQDSGGALNLFSAYSSTDVYSYLSLRWVAIG